MSKPLRSLRLSPRTNYERFTGVRGEIFYDPVNDTLRVFDSETQGGSVLATRTWVNTASTVNYNNLTNKPALAAVATTGSYTDLINRPETSQWKISADDSTVLTVPADESVSFRGQGMITTTVSNDSTGVQMIITAPELTQFIDVNQALGSETLIPSEFAAKGYADLLFNLQTAQLQNGSLDTTLNSVQFNSGVPIAEFSNDPTFTDNSPFAAPTEAAVRGYIDRRLGLTHNGDVVSQLNKIGPTYLTTDNLNNATLTGFTTIEETTEVITPLTGATGTVVHNLNTSAVFSHSSLSANFTANFTNVPTTNNRSIATTLILTQGATGRIPNAVQIDGAAQTINWQGGTPPTGNANKTDVVGFVLIRVGSAWTVIGSLTSYG